MPSAAFQALTVAVEEVKNLLGAQLSTGPIPQRLARARVVGRASVVLLASHFERYLYAVNEEAVTFLNDQKVQCDAIPEQIRLLHSVEPIDRFLETQWLNRASQLGTF